MHPLGTRRRLSISAVFGLPLALIFAVTGLFVYRTYEAVRAGESSHESLGTIARQSVLLEDIRAQYLGEWLTLVSTGPRDVGGFGSRFAAARANIDYSFSLLVANSARIGPEEEAHVAELARRHRDFSAAWAPVAALLAEGRNAEAEAALAGLALVNDGFLQSLADDVDLHRDDLDAALLNSESKREEWERWALGLAGVWLLGLAATGVLAQRWLLRPLADLARATRLMASGESVHFASPSGAVEIASLAANINLLAMSLRHRSEELNDYMARNLEARTVQLEAANEAIRASEHRLNTVIENAPLMIYALDKDGIVTFSGGRALALFDTTPAGLVGRSAMDIVSDDEATKASIRRALAGDEVTTMFERDGVTMEMHLTPVRDSNGDVTGIIGVSSDITQRRQAEASLRAYANSLEALTEQLADAHAVLSESQREIQEKSRQLERALEVERERSRLDPLTGALNHAGIIEVLGEVVAAGPEGPPAAVFMADIDAMKAANDMYGHQFGDQVLVAVKDALSRNGAVVGRYGGDEFVAVLPEANEDEVMAYRRAVLETMHHAALKDPESGNDVPILVSMGVAMFPTQAQRIDELIALADASMYGHKRERPLTVVEGQIRRLGGEQFVRVMGEIVPLLTAGGDPGARLAVVAERLATECQCDAVEIMINPFRVNGREIVALYPKPPADLEERWRDSRREIDYAGAMPALLARTRRPVIVDRPQEDERLAEFQRQRMRLNGIQSVLVAPLLWDDNLVGSLSVASRRASAFGPLDAQLLMGVASQVGAVVSMASLLTHFQGKAATFTTAHREAARLFAWAIDANRGPMSHDLDRLAAIAESLATRLGYNADEAAQIGIAAMLHDVGKYRVPVEVLSQPHDLSLDDWDVVRNHTIWGWELLREHPTFEIAAEVAHWHHERWDGCGYPDRLAGDSIPLHVAIASVADAVDAMIYDRVYRHGLGPDATIAEVIAGSGAQFNPRVVEVLVDLYRTGDLPLEPHTSTAAAA